MMTYEALVESQIKSDKNYDILKDPVSIPIALTIAVKWEDHGSMEQ